VLGIVGNSELVQEGRWIDAEFGLGMEMTRPQRVAIIGSSRGWVTLKNPLRQTATTPFHWVADMPASGASAWIPALLTTT